MEIFREVSKVKFSVLMSVYEKENPVYFLQAVESVMNQTVPPSEIVIVKDGRLTEKLEFVCKRLKDKYPDCLRYVPLEKNVGLGLALQKGVLECKYDLVARMDSDDISKPNRFEKQIKEFISQPSLEMCGGFIEEFSDSPTYIDSVRRVPLDKKGISNFAKKRNPFNHVSVMFRKESVIKVGNYQSFPLMEDYFLWVRMIMANCNMKNIPDILVSVRAGRSMTDRRGGWEYFLYEKRFYKELYKNGYISIGDLYTILFVRCMVRLCPGKIRGVVYKFFMR